MDQKSNRNRSPVVGSSQTLAAAITKSASKQTYYTIRFFVDRERIADAYRAYGYFRWVDDVLDAETGTTLEKIAFVNRQKSLLEACYRGETPDDLCAEEWMLIDLVRNDREANSGLQSYLRNMMAVMVLDVRRRDRLITQAELSEYSRMLATSVTEAYIISSVTTILHPATEVRYLAVTAAHITHMLRDAFEDAEAGYFNIPGEYLHGHGIAPQDVDSQAYREWVAKGFNWRAGISDMGGNAWRRSRICAAAWQAMLIRRASNGCCDAIERDSYCLRSEYPERKSLWAGLWMSWSILTSLFASAWKKLAGVKIWQYDLFASKRQ